MASTAPASEASFGFTKDTEAIARRPSFSNTLNDVCALVEKRAGSHGLLQKQSSTGQWNKRWFVIHGHYLSYYRKDPNLLAPDQRIPLGALDLWHVVGASLDDCTITLQLSEQASEARRDEMGGDLAKRVVSTAAQFSVFSKATIKRFDALRRQHIKPKFVVRCANAQEAQQWLSLMRESPLLGGLGALLGVKEGSASAVVEETATAEPRVKELCFSFGAREVVFGDVAAMFGDGVTELLLSNLAEERGECSVTLAGSGATTKPSRMQMVVPLKDAAGEIDIPIQGGTGLVVRIQWARKPIDYVVTVALPSAGLLVAVFLTVLIASRFRLVLALVMAVAAGTALAVHKVQKARARNDVLVRNVECVSSVVPVKKEDAGPQRKASVVAPPPATSSSANASKNITPQELVQLQELRARLGDMWQPSPKADELAKKYDKFFREFHADVSSLKNPAKLKQVMDKHVLVDFRLVRFLRARQHNLNKAEDMARDALTWRVVLGSDRFQEDPEVRDVPEWMINYFAGKYLLSILPASETRLANLYARDREGHCALFLRAGRIHTRKIFRKCDNKICFMTKFLVAAVEGMRLDLELLQEQTGAETVISIVLDLEGFSVGEQMPIGDLVALARRFFPIFATGFPELLHRVLIFNAPWLFGTLWSAVRPFVPEEVQSKITILSGAMNYEKHVGKHFERKYIPKYFGGDKVDVVDGNEFCTNMLAVYGPYSLPNEGHDELQGVDSKAAAW